MSIAKKTGLLVGAITALATLASTAEGGEGGEGGRGRKFKVYPPYSYYVEPPRVRVYQPEGSPPPGFVPVVATLEDAYLVLIKTAGLAGTSGRPALPPGVAILTTDGFLPDAAAAERGAP